MKKDRRHLTHILFFLNPGVLLLLTMTLMVYGCSQPQGAQLEFPTPTREKIATQPIDLGSIIKSTPSPVRLDEPCSPLEDVPLDHLEEYVSNPFNPSIIPDARDGGHHGVDFAYYRHPVTGMIMLGSSIYAVLHGKVASISSGKYPYGNVVMIETPVSELPAEIRRLVDSYPQPLPLVPENHLTCPQVIDVDPFWNSETPSIYILYAHMEEPAVLQIREYVDCGQLIGYVGNSGSSGNPHLHLEVRYGPGNATFTSLAHYSNDATSEEMANYCNWRVSGNFQLVDPMGLFIQVLK